MRTVTANPSPTRQHHSGVNQSLVALGAAPCQQLPSSLCTAKAEGGNCPPWGQLGDTSWHHAVLDVSAESLASPGPEVGRGRNFSVVTQGPTHAHAGTKWGTSTPVTPLC